MSSRFSLGISSSKPALRRLLDAQKHGRFRLRGPIQEPRHGTLLGQVLTQAGPGLPVQATEVEEKFLLLVPTVSSGMSTGPSSGARIICRSTSTTNGAGYPADKPLAVLAAPARRSCCRCSHC